jgi:four helix bundle protein
MDKTELEGRTSAFALGVIRFVESMPKERVSDVLGRQRLRSGTSIGANYHEANRAESRADFHHKIALCEKKAAKSHYWLKPCQEAS